MQKLFHHQFFKFAEQQDCQNRSSQKHYFYLDNLHKNHDENFGKYGTAKGWFSKEYKLINYCYKLLQEYVF
ncbi:hypothetical protein D0T90_08275 [Neisseria animalis]|uniref:Uncharacterized protein n=1 Tax=Neisseria animalis TaxID=492 RepID=A0A5P3MS87_NEIAN|nr:hypothetical protein D0T90_08275 [Neisseria animalis]ROW33117.1 hypothetical protein CGZ60_02430 [Neisseria animalis]